MAMACQMERGITCSGLMNETGSNSKNKRLLGYCSSSGVVQIAAAKPKELPALAVTYTGKPLAASDQNGLGDGTIKAPNSFSNNARSSHCVSRALRWWDKTVKPNMVEIHTARELVDSLLNAGDRLVIVDFYSPGCGGCKALHPKICMLAESNPDAIFLKVNYDELKPMCHSLRVHILPFFRLYRGAEGRLCSFSCTIATIKKFKDALAKYGTDRCSIGPAKGLDESEIQRLKSTGELAVSLPLSYTMDFASTSCRQI